MLQLWTLFYFLMLICLHSTYKKIIVCSESNNDYENLKLFKGFFPAVKDTVVNVFSYSMLFDNLIDEMVIHIIAIINILIEFTVFISFIVYLSKYWRLIFMVYLIK